MIEFLEYNHSQKLQYEAAWVLLNIASGTHEQTSVIVRFGAIPGLIKLISSSNIELKEQAMLCYLYL